MDNNQKAIKELNNEITSLKVRLRKVEGFIESMPNPEEYLPKDIGKGEDSLIKEAKEVVIKYDRASASLIQRRLSIGYARAARLLDMLENQGIVGPGTGSEPRQVLLKSK